MTSASMLPAPTPPSLWHVAAPAVLALLVVALGARIPMPGLDIAALAGQTAGGGMTRFSIFALGVFPLFTVLIHVEIARLIFPALAEWQAASGRNAARMGLVVKALALILTALQAHGLMIAFAAMGITDGSTVTAAAGIACLVGASAVLILLAERVRLPGLGSGLWPLLMLSTLGALPFDVATSVELVRGGARHATDSLFSGAFLVAAVVAVVVANALLTGGERRGEAGGDAIPLSVLLWPPFLANTVVGHLVAVEWLVFPGLFHGYAWLLDAAVLVQSALLIPLFVHAYSRLLLRERSDAERKGARPILLAVAGIQVFVCVGGGILDRVLFPPLVSPSGAMLIVCVTVMLALRRTFFLAAKRPE